MPVTDDWRTTSIEATAEFARAADPRELCDIVAGLSSAHDTGFARTLDLVGSHGLMSPRARAMLGSGLIDKMRQAGRPGSRVHAGSHWIDRIETIAAELAKRLFGVSHVELRPMSCAQANELVFAALARRGDTVVVQAQFDGADPSVGQETIGSLLGLEEIPLPFDAARLTIDTDRAVEAIEKIKPRLVVLSSGSILFANPVRELAQAAERVGARLFYDGAHVVGLAACGQYEDPIAGGAHVVTGSCPKTLCGPTGGIILTNDPEIGAAVEEVTSRFIASYPNSHLAALAVTFAELLQFGKAYGDAVVRNASALARALNEQGFRVIGERLGYTRSHLVLFDVADGDRVAAKRRLEAAGLFVTAMGMPGSPLAGVRAGTSSVTRRGMGESEMRAVAVLMRRVLLDSEPPQAVAGDVAELASGFAKVHFCFE